MDSAALLDLLGNENRRRILRLLARKPCYVTEISEYLGVSPKAVIEHLRKLEEAGLIESRVDDQRRKYFHIARNVRLEVNVSPYGFASKSAYPSNNSFDITTCRHLTFDATLDDTDDLDELLAALEDLEQLENELSLAQRWVQGRLYDVLDSISETVGAGPESRIYADLLASVRSEPKSVGDLSEDIDAPREVVAELLEVMADNGIVRRTEDGWELTTNG
ncbi:MULTISPECIES: ArsR/SmtB family transcription factor [Natrinema]|uniref:MarR family transcriptional regulator n=2 Tax=Natrinema TaxID=88723 RepID=A0A2A5R0M8_9EURY|nr:MULTISPECIES: metalloregulator ArsR/SmtB family transcription factor [Natrinema]MBZ6493493.1 metalloregulator ArsR/SmtB family transcription factor [Natrinema longum]PCR92612.1 MarR family transcriptional regulator [Natrinema ejinorense]QSW85159.1 metalloregulator ArsR/SmtB family transcription factor [Natrinema longum]